MISQAYDAYIYIDCAYKQFSLSFRLPHAVIPQRVALSAARATEQRVRKRKETAAEASTKGERALTHLQTDCIRAHLPACPKDLGVQWGKHAMRTMHKVAEKGANLLCTKAYCKFIVA